MRPWIPIVLLALASTASTGQARRDAVPDEERFAKMVEGLEPQKPVNCIDLRDAGNAESIGKSLVFRVSKRLVYRSETSGGCEGRSYEAFVTRTYGNRLCRGDVVSRADLRSGFSGGFCVAGQFTPYRAPKKAAR